MKGRYGTDLNFYSDAPRDGLWMRKRLLDVVDRAKWYPSCSVSISITTCSSEESEIETRDWNSIVDRTELNTHPCPSKALSQYSLSSRISALLMILTSSSLFFTRCSLLPNLVSSNSSGILSTFLANLSNCLSFPAPIIKNPPLPQGNTW